MNGRFINKGPPPVDGQQALYTFTAGMGAVIGMIYNPALMLTRSADEDEDEDVDEDEDEDDDFDDDFEDEEEE